MSDTRPSNDLCSRLRSEAQRVTPDHALLVTAALEIERLQRERDRWRDDAQALVETAKGLQRAAHEPPAALTAPLCPECGWVGEFKPAQPPCVHPDLAELSAILEEGKEESSVHRLRGAIIHALMVLNYKPTPTKSEGDSNG